MTGNSHHSGYARASSDFYVEPAWAVEALLRAELFEGVTLDPACGSGTIPITFEQAGCPAFGTDVAYGRGYGQGGVDFLSAQLAPVENVVTNPPFALAEAFAVRALALATRKVCVLQRLAWLESSRRREMFEATALTRVWVFSRRVSMPPGGTVTPARGGSVAYAWFVWEHGHHGSWQGGFLP